MAKTRQKKKASTRTTQATRKRTKQKDRRRPVSMAARARTELRSGNVPDVRAPESSRNADAYLTERSRERFANTFGRGRDGAQHAAEQSVGNLGPVLRSGTILASAMQSILQELFNFMQERMHQNFTRLLAFTLCRTPPQLVAAQTDFIRDNVASLARSTGRITDVSMQMAHEGMSRLSAMSLVPR